MRPALLIVALLAVAGTARADLGLDTLETDDLVLVYRDPLQSYLAPHAARCFENALAFHRELFDYTPSEPMTVLLNDFGDSGNASAGAVPRDLLMLETSPIGGAYETVSSNERMNWLMNHELVHVVTGDQAAGVDRATRRLFQGKVAPATENPESILWFWLTAPREAAPRWYHEGLAVFLETWMAGGIGRAQGPWDETVFRSMVRDGTTFHDPLSLVSEGTKIDFQVEVNSYLYGTRFLSYLAQAYSPQHVVRWARRERGGRRTYGARFREVFGLPLTEAWTAWTTWEAGFQEANLAAIRQYPTTPYRDLSPRALGSVSRAYVDAERRQVYAAFNYPGTVAHLGAISLDDGSVRRIVDVKGPVLFTVTSVAWDPARRKLFYTTDNRDYRDLREVDPDTGASRTLIRDARIGDIVLDPVTSDLWGVRHFNGIASIVRLAPPYTEWVRVRTFPYGEVPYDLDLSPDGRLLSASFAQVTGKHTLRVYELSALLAEQDQAPQPAHEIDFGDALPMTFVFSPDGAYLYGSSYYTGVANIFRYEMATRTREAVSNAETGFFRPVVLDGDRLLVFRYSGAGFVPAEIEAKPLQDVSAITFLGARIAAEHPVVRDWKVPSPALVPLDSMVRREGPYRSWRRVRVESIYPVAQGYKETYALGARLNLSDPLMLNRWSLVAAYTPVQSLPSDERLHLDLRWRRYDWRASATWNRADFYDFFGPTKTSRKGWSGALGWGRNLVYDLPRTLRLDADAAVYGDLDTLPAYQNVAASFDRLEAVEVKLAYRNVRSSLGAVDEEKGHAWELLAVGERGHCEPGACLDPSDPSRDFGGEASPKLVARTDLGLPLSQGHASLWLRLAAGVAGGDRDNPLASVYFGGFGNNWVDHRAIKRYRDTTSFPGLDLNAVAAQTFGKALLECNLPPLRFRRLGKPGLYASWARTSLFATALVADPDEDPVRRTLGNAGVQVDVRMTALSRLDLTLSLGAAAAFERGRSPEHEVMVSLKLLD